MTACCCPCHQTTQPGEPPTMTPAELVRFEKLARTLHPAVAAVMAFELENPGDITAHSTRHAWTRVHRKGAAA